MSKQTVFVPDTSPGMSISDKNMQLSVELANAPNNGRQIVRINRVDADSGWLITFLENSPREHAKRGTTERHVDFVN